MSGLELRVNLSSIRNKKLNLNFEWAHISKFNRTTQNYYQNTTLLHLGAWLDFSHIKQYKITEK